MKVFLGGSRRIVRLNSAMRQRLAELMERKLHVVIGDANGADRAMQRFFADAGYRDVAVFYVGSRPRNNEGAWPTVRVDAGSKRRGFEFFAAKDRAMTEQADCGVMLWDAESRGTLENVRRLVQARKPVSVYSARLSRFVNVESSSDLERLVRRPRLWSSATKTRAIPPAGRAALSQPPRFSRT